MCREQKPISGVLGSDRHTKDRWCVYLYSYFPYIFSISSSPILHSSFRHFKTLFSLL
jgi:hypothetical protein